MYFVYKLRYFVHPQSKGHLLLISGFKTISSKVPLHVTKQAAYMIDFSYFIFYTFNFCIGPDSWDKHKGPLKRTDQGKVGGRWEDNDQVFLMFFFFFYISDCPMVIAHGRNERVLALYLTNKEQNHPPRASSRLSPPQRFGWGGSAE